MNKHTLIEVHHSSIPAVECDAKDDYVIMSAKDVKDRCIRRALVLPAHLTDIEKVELRRKTVKMFMLEVSEGFYDDEE